MNYKLIKFKQSKAGNEHSTECEISNGICL
jgi:hypothetical protein